MRHHGDSFRFGSYKCVPVQTVVLTDLLSPHSLVWMYNLLWLSCEFGCWRSKRSLCPLICNTILFAVCVFYVNFHTYKNTWKGSRVCQQETIVVVCQQSSLRSSSTSLFAGSWRFLVVDAGVKRWLDYRFWFDVRTVLRCLHILFVPVFFPFVSHSSLLLLLSVIFQVSGSVRSIMTRMVEDERLMRSHWGRGFSEKGQGSVKATEFDRASATCRREKRPTVREQETVCWLDGGRTQNRPR